MDTSIEKLHALDVGSVNMKNNEEISLGALFKSKRKSQMISIKGLSEKTNISTSCIYKIERNSREVHNKEQTLKKLVKELNFQGKELEMVNHMIYKKNHIVEKPDGSKIVLKGSKKRIFEFVSSFCKVNGYAPTIREIRNNVGLASTSTVHAHVQSLVDMGVLNKKDFCPRTLVNKDTPEVETTNDNLRNTLGTRIRFFRKKIGKNQRQLSEELNISQSYLSELELGIKVCSLDLLFCLCTKMDLTVPEFLDAKICL